MVNQRLLDDDEEEYTSIEDIDKLKDEPMSIKTPYIIPLAT